MVMLCYAYYFTIQDFAGNFKAEAWTTRPCKGGESMAEQFEKALVTVSWEVKNMVGMSQAKIGWT